MWNPQRTTETNILCFLEWGRCVIKWAELIARKLGENSEFWRVDSNHKDWHQTIYNLELLRACRSLWSEEVEFAFYLSPIWPCGELKSPFHSLRIAQKITGEDTTSSGPSVLIGLLATLSSNHYLFRGWPEAWLRHQTLHVRIRVLCRSPILKYIISGCYGSCPKLTKWTIARLWCWLMWTKCPHSQASWAETTEVPEWQHPSLLHLWRLKCRKPTGEFVRVHTPASPSFLVLAFTMPLHSTQTLCNSWWVNYSPERWRFYI